MENHKILFVAAALSLSVSGCSSAPTPCPVPQERIINIPLEVPGAELQESDVRRLRKPENVKAYYTGRYIDPNNPDVMYESNTLYRVESKNDWVKTPRKVEDVPSGVAMKIGTDKAIQALITEFKQDMKILQMTLQKLTSLEGELKSARSELINSQKQMKSFEGQIVQTQAKNEEILKKYESLDTKIAAIENKQLFSVPSNEPPKPENKESKPSAMDKIFKQ